MSSWGMIQEIVSPTVQPLLSLQPRGCRMKLSNLSERSTSRVTYAWDGTIVVTLAISGYKVVDKEGSASTGIDGWMLVAMGATAESGPSLALWWGLP